MYEFLEAEAAGFEHGSRLGCRWSGGSACASAASASDASTATGMGGTVAVVGAGASTSTADSNGKAGTGLVLANACSHHASAKHVCCAFLGLWLSHTFEA